jgi:hypothetical protein
MKSEFTTFLFHLWIIITAIVIAFGIHKFISHIKKIKQ